MKEDKYLLTSLDNALHLLDILSHYHSLSLAELSRMSSLSKTSVFRMLHTLEQNQYVEKLPDGRYVLGIKFLYFENNVAARYDVVTIARPYMAGLCFHCRNVVHLGILNGNRIITVHKEISPYDLTVTARVGMNAPAYSTAMGKVILAHLPEIEAGAVIDSFAFKKYSTSSITNKKDFLTALQEIRKSGYATDVNERYQGFGAVAVPIYDHTGHCTAALSIICLSSDVSSLVTENLLELKNTADEISAAMGYRPDPGSLLF